MASIKISNLQPIGSEFFNDSESFLDSLSESELSNTNGGATPTVLVIMSIEVGTGWFAVGALLGAGAAVADSNN